MLKLNNHDKGVATVLANVRIIIVVPSKRRAAAAICQAIERVIAQTAREADVSLMAAAKFAGGGALDVSGIITTVV